MNDEIKAWAERFAAWLDSLAAGLEKSAKKAEAELVRSVLSQLLPRLSKRDGKISITAANIARANIIDRAMAEFSDGSMAKIAETVANKALEIPGINADYYIATGIDRGLVRSVARDTERLSALFGIRKDGGLEVGGWLWRVARLQQTADELRYFVAVSIATGTGAEQLEKGIRGIISGNGDGGAVTQYLRRYVYDAVSKAREVDNERFAEAIGLRHFVYVGGLVEKSRDFCRKKDGKVFTTEEAERDWPKDPDLVDKATVSRYKPLIDRGRYNCRHFLMYITEEEAERLKAQGR